MGTIVAWAADAAAAEQRHGVQRERCLGRLDPENRGRWPESARRTLARAAWESGWDSGVEAVRGEACAALERAGWHAAAALLRDQRKEGA